MLHLPTRTSHLRFVRPPFHSADLYKTFSIQRNRTVGRLLSVRRLLSMNYPSKLPPLALPTSDRLGTTVSADAFPTSIARTWFNALSQAIEAQDAATASQLFMTDGFWRDILALTSDYRTFHGVSDIERLLQARLSTVQFSNLRLAEEIPRNPVFRTPFPDLTLLQICFDFETGIGKGTGICRLAQCAPDEWKAYTMFTCLDSLKEHPEKVCLTFYAVVSNRP